MRVIHIIDNLVPGGTEKQCLELVRGLSSQGVSNGVLYFRGGAVLGELERLDVAPEALPNGSFRSARFPLRVLGLAAAIRRRAPDVLQTYGFYSDLPGLLAGFLARVPVRVAARRAHGQYLRPAQHRVNRWVWRLADRIVVNANAVRDYLVSRERVPRRKIVVIRNGVDLRCWPPRDGSELDDDDVVVGMVAHFREMKDHGNFLNAARAIVEVVPAARFCLVGAGPLEEAVRQRAVQLGIAARVAFLGCLDGEALRAAMGKFRVSVLASKSTEGLPNVVLESMAVGLPVVATAVGGTPELIEDGFTGFLVPPEDHAVLAERVLRLLKEPSLARVMGERGRQKVERGFTLPRMVDQFHELYRDLLGGKGRLGHQRGGR